MGLLSQIKTIFMLTLYVSIVLFSFEICLCLLRLVPYIYVHMIDTGKIEFNLYFRMYENLFEERE